MPRTTTRSGIKQNHPKLSSSTTFTNTNSSITIWYCMLFGLVGFWSKAPSVLSWSTRRSYHHRHNLHPLKSRHCFQRIQGLTSQHQLFGSSSIARTSSSTRRSMSSQPTPGSSSDDVAIGNTSLKNYDGNANRKLVVVLAGPTGVGKSDVAALLCGAASSSSSSATTTTTKSTGMIVSADSVQAYRGVMIGANKPTLAERQETPHMLVDVVDHNTTNYNAADWQRDALHVISKLLVLPDDDDNANKDTAATTPTLPIGTDDDEAVVQQARQERQRDIDQSIAEARVLKGFSPDEPIVPVVVGGTMMYLQWLVHGRPDAAKPSREAVAQAIEEMAVFETAKNTNTKNVSDDASIAAGDWEGAVKHVESHGPVFVERVAKLCGRDWYRLRRTLEIALTVKQQVEEQHNQSGQEQSSEQQTQIENKILENMFTGEREGALSSYGYDVRCFFLCPDDRMKHTELVDERCEIMLTKGLLNETTSLKLAGELPEMASRAIGYRQTLEYLEREDPKDGDEDALNEYMNKFTTATRQYSKKQMQWFRKDDNFVFVPAAVSENKATRVEAAAKAIGELIQLPREEYDRQCFADDNSISAQTMQQNVDQAKGMKFYQFKRFLLKPGTPELEKVLAEADRCTNQLQAKKRRVETSAVELP